MEAKTRTRLCGLVLLPPALALMTACGGGDPDGTAPPAAAEGADGPDGTVPLAVAEGADGSPPAFLVTTENGLRLRPAEGERLAVDRRVDRRVTHRDGTWVVDLSCAADGDRKGRAEGEEACPRMPEVDVPAGAVVTVLARNAGVEAVGVDAELDLSTVNGDVTVAGSGRDDARLRLATRNGSVAATAVRGFEVHAHTVNGDVTLGCAYAPDTVGASTTNGSVGVSVPADAPAYRVTARTANGRPSVTVPTGGAAEGRSMTLTTVNGDVTAARE
ncbi:DUF4097 family beta strand repeat-containing protein [Streptomyces sp. NPDC003247]|uniref:DUF4097 family beta strand repeat-containing protein n=1 Tax=Streptomyces sp. NPDC003247 TaxID=3364677 RepID=UPI0036A670A1